MPGNCASTGKEWCFPPEQSLITSADDLDDALPLLLVDLFASYRTHRPSGNVRVTAGGLFSSRILLFLATCAVSPTSITQRQSRISCMHLPPLPRVFASLAKTSKRTTWRPIDRERCRCRRRTFSRRVKRIRACLEARHLAFRCIIASASQISMMSECVVHGSRKDFRSLV